MQRVTCALCGRPIVGEAGATLPCPSCGVPATLPGDAAGEAAGAAPAAAPQTPATPPAPLVPPASATPPTSATPPDVRAADGHGTCALCGRAVEGAVGASVPCPSCGVPVTLTAPVDAGAVVPAIAVADAATQVASPAPETPAASAAPIISDADDGRTRAADPEPVAEVAAAGAAEPVALPATETAVVPPSGLVAAAPAVPDAVTPPAPATDPAPQAASPQAAPMYPGAMQPMPGYPAYPPAVPVPGYAPPSTPLGYGYPGQPSMPLTQPMYAPPTPPKRGPSTVLIVLSVIALVVLLACVITGAAILSIRGSFFISGDPSVSRAPTPTVNTTPTVPAGFALHTSTDGDYTLLVPSSWITARQSVSGVTIDSYIAGAGGATGFAVESRSSVPLEGNETAFFDAIFTGLSTTSTVDSRGQLTHVPFGQTTWAEEAADATEKSTGKHEHLVVDAVTHGGKTYIIVSVAPQESFATQDGTYFQVMKQSFTFMK